RAAEPYSGDVSPRDMRRGGSGPDERGRVSPREERNRGNDSRRPPRDKQPKKSGQDNAYDLGHRRDSVRETRTLREPPSRRLPDANARTHATDRQVARPRAPRPESVSRPESGRRSTARRSPAPRPRRNDNRDKRHS